VEAQRLFMMIDTDRNGVLTLNELLPVVFTKASSSQLKLMEDLIQHENAKVKRPSTIELTHTDYMLLFDLFDADESGDLTINEVVNALMNHGDGILGRFLSPADVKKLFKKFDFDHSDSLDREEFVELFHEMLQ
jgi:Ca2+-binding EF-hand superfamily protein